MTSPPEASPAGPRLCPERGVVVSRPGDAGPDPSTLEWVLTDGRGSFAHGTVDGVPRRRYHGLLTTPLGPDATRHLLVGHVEEQVTVRAGATTRLAPGSAAEGELDLPAARLLEFALYPWPTWTYACGDAVVLREVLLRADAPAGGSGVLVRWSVRRANGPLTLRVAPFLPFRETHALTFANDALDAGATLTSTGADACAVRVRPYASLPPLHVGVEGAAASWHADPRWLRGLPLPAERARGFDWHEDRCSPGAFEATLAPGGGVLLELRTAEPAEAAGVAWERAAARARELWRRATAAPTVSLALHRRAADDFLYTAPLAGAAGPSRRLGVLAGFPWFGEWGRDVFLSAPGATLARGDAEASAAVTDGALPFLRDGLLPNIYGPDPERSHYGSVDAALWFARAARLHRLASPTGAAVPRWRAALARVRASYAAGTALGIRGEAGGLVLAGGPDLNPTWMDAQTSAGPVTPRAGCPVEIAALWILLLAELEETAEHVDERAELAAARERACASFRARFWLADDGYLADLWTPDGTDAAVRPNMVLAAALDTTPLAPDEAARLLARVDAELLTARGLRTLSPRDPAYRPRYEGGPDERDGAYHQGTVWPWLLGAYVELCLRVRGADDRPRLERLLDGLDAELLRAGLGHVSEVFDGDPPHRPGGTPAQAWSTAELLRARALLEAVEVTVR